METALIKEKQDLRFLKWSHVRNSSGTAGTFLKSQSNIGTRKIYYKLSNYDSVLGVVGHECVNEIIVDRLLTVLGIEHLHYQLINAVIEIDGVEHNTYLCASEDFKKRGESKTTLENYYEVNKQSGESHYDFCKRNHWQDYIDTMLAVDYIILNRDRHGANIEVLRNARTHSIRIAPLFDHGLSLLFSCGNDETAAKFDVTEDRACQNFIGSRSCFDNLSLIQNKDAVFRNDLKPEHKTIIFDGLEDVISPVLTEQIWNLIRTRYEIYENL